jgi:hypothetical protein
MNQIFIPLKMEKPLNGHKRILIQRNLGSISKGQQEQLDQRLEKAVGVER